MLSLYFFSTFPISLFLPFSHFLFVCVFIYLSRGGKRNRFWQQYICDISSFIHSLVFFLSVSFFLFKSQDHMLYTDLVRTCFLSISVFLSLFISFFSYTLFFPICLSWYLFSLLSDTSFFLFIYVFLSLSLSLFQFLSLFLIREKDEWDPMLYITLVRTCLWNLFRFFICI